MSKEFFLAVVLLALGANVKSDYVGAVVEYNTFKGRTPNNTVEQNINEYVGHIEIAKKDKVDIIVFPEYGLTGLVDDPTDYAISIPEVGSTPPYTNYWLKLLSNAAIEHTMYVVVNLLEKGKNSNNDTIYYNTNIAFDRKGTLVGKYRKVNLYFEPNITPGKNISIFTTDFGVTFGLISTLDMEYYFPARSILEDGRVTDIAMPTAWVSTLPFFLSLTAEVAYASGARVNLLAANLNEPNGSIGGSGIYGYDGTIVTYYIAGKASSKLLTGIVKPRSSEDSGSPFATFGFDILNNNTQPEINNYVTHRDFDSSKYTFRRLELNTSAVIRHQVCDNSYFCCNFTIKVAEANVSEVYNLLVYDGPSKLADRTRNIKICSLIACETDDPSSCGTRNVTSTTKFKEISISGDFARHPQQFFQPATLKTDLVPVFNTSFSSVRKDNETISVSLNSTKTVEKLIVFGIVGRGSGTALVSSYVFLIAAAIMKYFF